MEKVCGKRIGMVMSWVSFGPFLKLDNGYGVNNCLTPVKTLKALCEENKKKALSILEQLTTVNCEYTNQKNSILTKNGKILSYKLNPMSENSDDFVKNEINRLFVGGGKK
jgi:hypothetical protein